MNIDPKSRDKRDRLAAMILPMISDSNSTGVNTTIRPIMIPFIFPRYLYVSTKGVKPVNNLDTEYLNLTLQMNCIGKTSAWWEIHEFRKSNIFQPERGNNSVRLQRNALLVTFNERVAPTFLATITQYGVVGLYVSLVFVVGKVVRLLTGKLSYSVIYTEMPYVGRILRQCQDIYLVRESGNMALEEELFAKLIFLYRSPETLIKVTRPKVE
ncbi:Piezo-type mechanosensitive ion channel component 2 [Lamellibrachia satsuma]|nr:Piezo-type mechanosensitive ion channel component 2 [Lamellibrachia satsuma]